MPTWTAEIKETITRTLIIEVEAEHWEEAEDKAREIAWNTPADAWETADDRRGYQIEVEENDE